MCPDFFGGGKLNSRCLDQPSTAFELAFGDLEPERIRESGSREYESRSLGSRTLVHVACAAAGHIANGLARFHSEGERERFCDVLWGSVRRLWLRAPLQIGQDINHLVAYFFAWLPLSVGIRSDFLVAALSFVVPDPNLLVEVCKVWYSNGNEARDIAPVLEAVGTPLGELIEQLETAPGGLSLPDETLDTLHMILEDSLGTNA